jgi:hypothetical protein
MQTPKKKGATKQELVSNNQIVSNEGGLYKRPQELENVPSGTA